jgi:hypothetical protein
MNLTLQMMAGAIVEEQAEFQKEGLHKKFGYMSMH